MKKALLIVLVVFAKKIDAQCSVTITGNNAVCYGNTDTLTASGATSYTWMPGGINTSSITVGPSVTTIYTVTGTTGTCTATNTIEVVVHQQPTATFTLIPDTASNTITVLVNYSSNVINAEWFWYDGTGNSFGLYPSHIMPLSSAPFASYSVCISLTDSFGCSNISNGFFCQGGTYDNVDNYGALIFNVVNGNNQTTTISQISGLNPKILVYPNPANNIIYIQARETGEITLCDLLGNKILTTKENEIDVSNLTNGVYFIKVNNNTQKIIVQH